MEDVKELLRRVDLNPDGITRDDLITIAHGDPVVGFAAIEPYAADGLLRSVAVDPSMRGTGLGRRLVSEVETSARQHGIRTLFLLTTTVPGFFERLDYEIVNRDDVPESVRGSDQFATLCPASATVMRKRLEPIS